MEVMASRVVVRNVLLLICGFHGVGVSGTWRFVDCRSSAADRPSRVTRHGERLIGPEQAGILKLFEAHTGTTSSRQANGKSTPDRFITTTNNAGYINRNRMAKFGPHLPGVSCKFKFSRMATVRTAGPPSKNVTENIDEVAVLQERLKRATPSWWT